MTRPMSLKARLAGASLVLIVTALAATGLVLMLLFRSHIERRFDMMLHDHLEELAAAAEADANGELKLTWEPYDPRFKPPLSGWYWEMRSGGRTLRHSASLADGQLSIVSPGAGRPHSLGYVSAPDGERLRYIVQDVLLPGRTEPVTLIVAGPCSDIHRDVRSFAGMLALSLGVLALLLGALVMVQVGYGLKPLAAVSSALNEVRRGGRERLDESDAPVEVQPLIAEVNALIGQRQAMVERARAEAGDLAHALKTPIAVIANEAERVAAESGALLKAEAGRMRRAVERHLVQARAAPGLRAAGARAAVDAVLDDVRFLFERLHPDRRLTVDARKGLMFAGELDDLADMVGNLADNAAKWARSCVRVTAGQVGERLRITVEDDGPGLAEAEQKLALARGERLDVRKPGHGLGLSIVAHLAELNGGRLELSRSDGLGGLRAMLDLPAVL